MPRTTGNTSDYICMDGRVLSSEEGQEERTEEKVECNLSADGGELLSTQEDDTDAQGCLENPNSE